MRGGGATAVGRGARGGCAAVGRGPAYAPPMSPPIDSLRGAASVRRTKKAAAARSEASSGAEVANLPVPVDAPKTLPAGPANAGGDTAIRAQVIGERRGLPAGPTIHDEAPSR